MNQQQYREAIETDEVVQSGKAAFFEHVETCITCTTGRCVTADHIWRAVLVRSLSVVRDAARAARGGA